MVELCLLLGLLDLVNAGLWLGLGYPIVGIIWLCAAGCAFAAAYGLSRG